MLNFLIKRIAYGILVLIGVVVLVFFLFQGFGDPARLVLGQSGDSATIQNVRKELALDQPKWKQFVLYLNDVSPVSVNTQQEINDKQLKGFFIGGKEKIGIKIPYLRRSYQTKQQVSEVLMDALPGTIILAFAAIVVAIVLGIPLGILSAIKKGTWLDTSSVFASVLGISAPSFFIGIIVAYLFGFVLHKYTGLYMTGSLYEYDAINGKHLALQNLILPAITLGIRPLAIIVQLTRSTMLDVLNKDYIRTAFAKGLSKNAVVWKHALPNALNPVMTAVTGWFAELLAGAFFVEYIFNWKGIGKTTVDALDNLDFPVVMGSVLITAAFFVAVNILADVLYGIIDPRIRIK
ncbi:ABC transporter permease [Arachidicoccus ginsenosidimutans]|uniref:ABC transporter permease n=1 Tax=Arachidicoccus sp. BS20 TaxID=1850526 RepID=UPI0007F09BE5|nr:ABC transporter permease [Arachidicoccus sp. BS20]ANI88561.1 ABC transporter permease [Arachidicoccus sp. BS20]